MSFIETEAEFIKQEATFLGAIAAVRIEDPTDEAFWTTVFEATIPDKKIAFYPYSNTPTPQTTGKKSVLKYRNFADAQLWLCIDSDYDYLRQSDEIKHPFILQTYLYAVENYRCYAPNLSKVLQNAVALTNIEVDFTLFFTEYSKIIHELLICSILAEDTEGIIFSANDCGETVALPQHFDNINTVLDMLKVKVEPKLETLKTTFAAIFEIKKTEFAHLGLTELRAYSFLNGHKLLDNVVIPLLEHYAYRLKNQHLMQIKRLQNTDERIAALQQYHTQIMSIEKALKGNDDFVSCPFFIKIQDDVRRIIS